MTEIYSHILDEGRQHNASLIEEAFYKKESGKEDKGLKKERQEHGDKDAGRDPDKNPDVQEEDTQIAEEKQESNVSRENTFHSQESEPVRGNTSQSKESGPEDAGNDLATLMRLLQKPELASVLKSLANAI